MYINISDSKSTKNKGSSGELIRYLEIENRFSNQQEPEYWFNQTGSRIEPFEIRSALDRNVAKLSKKDAKFFLINISPSQKELLHLQHQFGNKDVKDALKHYTSLLMNEYAKNFQRKGVKSSSDLLWFGKVENYRYYGYKDKEVIDGSKKRGEQKPGEQMHIQVIVSRKDITNTIKLSPMNNSKGKNQEHSKKLGQFNRLAFKQSGETVFDALFDFDRKLPDTLAYANIAKNGSLSQKEQLDTLTLGAKSNDFSASIANVPAKEVAKGIFHSTSEMLSSVGQKITGFLEMMSEPVYSMGEYVIPIEEQEQHKKRKRKGQRTRYR